MEPQRDLLHILPQCSIPLSEITLQQVRAQGAGGQNVNKVASAVHLRFNIGESSLPERIQASLLRLADSRITEGGVVIIKAQNHRTFERNREEALSRLAALIRQAAIPRKKRRPTRPTASSQKKRLDKKTRHSQLKQLRKKFTC